MKTKTHFYGISCLLLTLALLGCSSAAKEEAECTDSECARETTVKLQDTPKSEPGTITVLCGVFVDGAEAASPCESVLVKVFSGESATPKAELTLSGERLVIPGIGRGETISLNLMLKNCTKPNILPGLKSQDTRETYFKTPCR